VKGTHGFGQRRAIELEAAREKVGVEEIPDAAVTVA
jgi:hypothetical protein